jgi:hypothetical protein
MCDLKEISKQQMLFCTLSICYCCVDFKILKNTKLNDCLINPHENTITGKCTEPTIADIIRRVPGGNNTYNCYVTPDLRKVIDMCIQRETTHCSTCAPLPYSWQDIQAFTKDRKRQVCGVEVFLFSHFYNNGDVFC